MRILHIISILFCTAFYLTSSIEAWGWGSGHRVSRAASLKALSQEELEWWGEWRDITLNELTLLPDIAAGNKEPSSDPKIARAQHFNILINGRQFHYMNGLITPKDQRAIVVPGILQCLERAITAIAQDNREEAAGRLAYLAHVLEDASSLHCLDSLGVFILDELFTPPEDKSFTSPSQLIVERERFTVDLGDYRPVLLGRSPQEATETGFHRFLQIQKQARHCLPDLIRAGYAEDWEAFDTIMGKMALPASRLVADFYHTAFVLAKLKDEPFSISQSLTGIIPEITRKFTSHPYRFTPMVEGFNLDKARMPVPLKLKVKTTTGIVVKTFEEGYGAGAPFYVAYRIPRGLYDKFTATVGMNTELSTEGHGRIVIHLDDSVLYDSKMIGAGEPATEVEIPLKQGGLLKFTFENGPEIKEPAHSQHFVLGAPLLYRSTPPTP